MGNRLKGLKVAMLVANGFEQSEMTEPKKALENEGAIVDIISPEKNKVKGWKHAEWGDEFQINQELNSANAKDYHAIVLPGGVMNPDYLRMNEKAVQFVKTFISEKKPVAAICHGPWTLINAEGVKDKTLTSWPSIKTDLINAGAKWVDKEVVRDDTLITSRKPEDIPAFNAEIITLFSEQLK